MKTKIIMLFLVMIMFTSCEMKRNDQISFRTPTEQELQSFLDSHGVKVLAKKLYSDYAIILGDNSVYSLSFTNDNKPQYLGSSWNGAPERIDVTAVTQETTFIGVIIHRNDVLEKGQKLKVTFEDGSSVETIMNHEQAFIVDHPSGKLTNSSKAKVQVLDRKDEIIYKNF